MSSVASQAYLNTRVSIMATQLLDHQRVTTLSRLGLHELAERFGLPALLDEGLDARAKSRAVEQALIQTLFAELAVLIRPMRAAERALTLDWGRKFALVNLKTLIRGKLHELDQKEIRENLYDLPPGVRLPRTDLFRAENVLELLRQLEDGPYRLIARQAREIFEQHREPFALEATIDQRYYAGLMRQVQQLGGEDAEPMRDLFGALLDRVDLLWLLRFRFSFALSPSETYYQLVPSPRLLHRERLLKLVNLDSYEQVLAALPAPLDALLADSTNLIDVQRRTGARFCVQAQEVLLRSRSAIARALAYLMLREMDLWLVFSLIQGRLLELPTELVDIAMELAEPSCPLGGLAEAA